MEIISHAESIELKQNDFSAVIVAEGLRSWSDPSGRMLISRGPRFKAKSESLGRLRPVPDRLGVIDEKAETHAVILARNCRTEEMELTQKWSFTPAGELTAEMEFIIPPACSGLEYIGAELEFPGETPAFELQITNGTAEYSAEGSSGFIGVFLPDPPVPSGIYRMNLVFVAKN